MKTIDCAAAAAALSAWIDGELDEPTATAVRDHVAGCASCRRRHALLAAVGEAVRRLPPETVSEGFAEAFRRRRAGASARRAGMRRPAVLFAAGLAAALVAAWLVRPAGPDRPMLSPAPLAATAVRAGAWPAADCGLGPAARCRLETPCASAASCGRAATVDWEPTARHAPALPGVR